MANPRKPTVLKLVEGTYRPDRANSAEPALHVAAPKPPKHLSARARKAWPAVASLLEGMRVLTAAGAFALEALCECYVELVEARETLRANGGATYVTGGGMLRPHPAAAHAADADRRLRSWLNEFGLTPAARSKVSANADQGETNPFADL
jgi:P27 family predicted phage terminase small subunit